MYLGFNCYMRDAAAALVSDGRVLMAVEEERLTRQKHTGVFPARAIQACLDAAPRPLQGVAFNMRPWEAVPGRLAEIVRGLPNTLAFGQSRGGDFVQMCLAERRFRAAHSGDFAFSWIQHHEAHAASAFLFAPFDEAAVLVADGSGELASTTAWMGYGATLRRLHATPFPNSLGYFYSALTEWLGFPPASDEGTVMGLSSYGSANPALDLAFAEAIDLDGRIDRRFFRFQDGGARYFGPRWEAVFGAARHPSEPMAPRHEDVAAAGQRRLEAVLLHLSRRLRAHSRNLCLAGGVALNCVANTRLCEEAGFDQVFVQPAAGDAGTALGAAALLDARARGRRPEPMRRADLGPHYSRSRVLSAIQSAGLVGVEPADPASDAAQRLAEGAVIGRFAGRSEFGPRALGHRSLLADPRRPEMRERVNRVVKRREAFRPFAPAFMAEHCADWLDGPVTAFMTTVCRVRAERREQLGAVTHVDGTARAQAVDRVQSPGLWALIEAFRARTGVPAVLNTSFNLKGEPIVETPEEALRDLVEAELDAVYLDGVRVDHPHR